MEKIFQSLVFCRADFEIMQNVKKIRELKGVSTRVLSEKMGLSKSFVGKVESLITIDKYNLYHLLKIMEIFEIKEYDEIFPSLPFDNDLIKVLYKKALPTLENKKGEIIVVDVIKINVTR